MSMKSVDKVSPPTQAPVVTVYYTVVSMRSTEDRSSSRCSCWLRPLWAGGLLSFTLISAQTRQCTLHWSFGSLICQRSSQYFRKLVLLRNI